MKVILIAVMSIDGKIAQASGQSSLDWTTKEDMRFFVEQTKAAGVMIMGRKTFETIGKALPGRETVVMTRNPVLPLPKGELEGVCVAGSVRFTNKTPKELTDEYKANGQQSIVIAGGAGVYSAFIREGLVTDYYLTIQPVLFGEGVPLASGFDRLNLKLVETKMLGEQTVLFHYQPISV